MPRRIVIIGCGVSGTTAAFHARKTDRTARIVLLGDEDLPEYSRCGLLYAFSHVVPSLDALIGYDEAFYEQMNRIDLRLGLKATKIHTEKRSVEATRAKDNSTEALDYDTLVLTTRARAEEHGVEYYLNSTLDEIVGQDGRVSGIRISGENYPVDAVVVAVRVKPNTELAKEAGIVLGESGGIKTDERMATSAANVYAAGDCIETYDRITRRHVFFQLATTAVRQALVAGINAAGGNAKYPGSTGVTTVKLFGLEVASFGPTTTISEKLGTHPVSVRVTGSTRLPYYPGGKDLTVKLLADPKDGRLLGAQLVGEEGATLRANLASMAGHLGLSVEEFEQIETCYSPPLAPVWDPVTIAAQALLRKLQTSQAVKSRPVTTVES